jgi:hypothetical protein
MAAKRKQKCLACKAKPYSRGLCQACYTAARRLIEQGRRTETELIDSGAILPRQRQGCKLGSAFLKRMETLEAKR